MRQGPEFLADQCKRVWPLDRYIMVRSRVVHHRMGDPTLLLEPVVGPPGKLGHRMLAEEFRRRASGGRLPRQCLSAVLANYQRSDRLRGRVRPRATRAFEATGLVHRVKRGSTLEEHLLL